MRGHHRHGFTLIELLVVVTIIVGLLALLMPAIGRAVELSHGAVCQNVLRQTTLANLGYAADYQSTYIYNTYGSATYKGRNYLKYWATDPDFVPRVGLTTEEVSTAWHPAAPKNGGVRWPDNFDCPSDIQPNTMTGNDTWGHELGIGYSRGWNGHSNFYTLSTVVKPSGKFQFGDGPHWWMDGTKASYRQYTAIGQIPDAGWGAPIPRHNGSASSKAFAYYSGAGSNFAFYDAHAEYVPLEETYVYKNDTGLTQDAEGNKRLWDPTY